MKNIKQNFKDRIKVIFFLSLIITVFATLKLSAQTEAVIYLDSTRQIIRGFGAANIVTWRPDMTEDEINTAFGTGEGQLGFSILRFRIPPDQNSFSINLPSAQLAYSMGVTLIASPWSPPASMKTNNSIIGGELKEDSYNDFALYLKSFADYMSNNGAPIYAISVQNEPDANVSYESCFWTGNQFLNFFKNNAASIGARVFMPESENFNHSYSDPTLNDPDAAANVAFIGGHLYGGGLTGYPLATSKGKELWMTEYLDTDTSWARVLATGKQINDCMNVGMSAYVWWYIVRFYGPILEDGNVSKRGYVMSQYSRFIRPGYHRVDIDHNPQTGVYLTAYRSDDQVVIVAINNSSSSKDQTFTLHNGTVAMFTPYITSQTKNCLQESSISVSNKSFSVTLDPSSVTTFVSNVEPGLPVELVSFNAKVVGAQVQLSWSTATETNNAGFEIQRSIDNKEFVTIGYVEGKGTITERQTYSYVDNVSGRNFYYRLKQVDFNGSFKYSNIIEVKTVPAKFGLFQNYPNPFNPTTKIQYSIPQSGYISLKVFNMLGQEVTTLFEGYQRAGNYSVSFNATGLASGIYFYRLNCDSFVETKKLILLK